MISGQENKSTTNQQYVSVGSYRYRPSDLLGSGYTSKVYKAVHSIKKFPAALKIIQIDKIQSKISLNLLDSELRCLQALKGTPHIINLLDVVKTEGILYVVTELCQGDLTVKNKKKIPESQLWLYMKQLLKAYKSLYQKGIVHRDIKPENLLIKSQGMIKIGDFGFATTLAEAKQQNYYSIGSPSYMSPEVLHRNDYSFASDIWSIGVTYYELATGKLPWKGEQQQIIRSQINHQSIGKIIKLSGLSQVSKKFLEQTLCYQYYNRIKPDQLFEFEFFELPLQIKQKSQQINFDKNSYSTASTPRIAYRKFQQMLNVETSLTENKSDFYENCSHKNIQMKNCSDRRSRKLSYDYSLIGFQKSKRQFQNSRPQQKIINSQKTITNQNTTGFKKKHRGSFDVVHQTRMQKDIGGMVGTLIEKLVARHFEIIQILFSFLQQFQEINSIQKWAEDIQVFKVCLRNYIVITVGKLMNLDSSDLLVATIPQDQIKKHIKSKKIDLLIYENRAKLQQNKELAKHWIRAKQQKPRAISNSGLSIIKTIKKTLTSSCPQLLMQMMGKICIIVQIFSELTKNSDVTMLSTLDNLKNQKKTSNFQSLLAQIERIEKLR